MQLDNSNRYVPKKKNWIPYLLGGSVGLLVMVISLFLIFPSGKGKEENGGLDKTKITQVTQSLTKNELEERSFDELSQLADNATPVSENISDNDEIYSSDKKLVLLHIYDSKLVSVKIKTQVIVQEGTIKQSNSPKESSNISKSEKNNNKEISNSKQNDNKDFVTLEASQGIYKIQTQEAGETIRQLINRIKKETKYKCTNPGTRDEILTLNKKNLEMKKEVYKKLVNDETFVLKGIWIWVKCK